MAKYSPEYYEMDVPIRKFVTKSLIGIGKDESVQRAAQRMVEFDISSLVVLDDSEIVGFFTDGDIKAKVAAKGRKPDIPVKEVMSTDLITADIGASVKEVTTLMTKNRIKHVLVKEEGDIVGMLSFRDLLGVETRKLETYISRE